MGTSARHCLQGTEDSAVGSGAMHSGRLPGGGDTKPKRGEGGHSRQRDKGPEGWNLKACPESHRIRSISFGISRDCEDVSCSFLVTSILFSQLLEGLRKCRIRRDTSFIE